MKYETAPRIGAQDRSATDSPRHPVPLPWHRWFLVLGLAGGLALILAIAPLGGVDELSHTFRLETIDRGWLVAPPSDQNPSGYVVSGCLTGLLYKQDQGFEARFRNVACLEDAPARYDPLEVIRGSESYPFTSYLLAWPGYRVGRALHGAVGSIYGARLTQLIAYVGLTAAAISLLPRGRPFLFALGLLPVVLQNSSTISVDPFLYAVVFVSVALTLRITEQAREGSAASGKQLVALGVLMLALATAKPGYAGLALMVAIIPTAAFGSTARRGVIVLAMLASVLVVSLAWIGLVTQRLDAPNRPNTDPTAQARLVAEDPLTFSRTIARTWTDTAEVATIAKGLVVPIHRWPGNPDIPILMVPVVMGVLTVAFLSEGRRTRPATDAPVGPVVDTRDQRRSLALALAVMGIVSTSFFLVINYALYTGNTPVGGPQVNGIQGRYFLPLVPMLLLVPRRTVPNVSSRASAVGIVLFCTGLAAWWATVRFRS